METNNPVLCSSPPGSPRRRLTSRLPRPPVPEVFIPSLPIDHHEKPRRRHNPVLVLVFGYLLFGVGFCLFLLLPVVSWNQALSRLWRGTGSGDQTGSDSFERGTIPQHHLECGFQTYRHPLHHEGLPTLVEVFHTDDSVYFGALNEGICEPEWRVGHNFSTAHTFVCEFDDGQFVESDPLPPTRPNDIWVTSILVIRCPLPKRYSNSNNAILTVSLHAKTDLEASSSSPTGSHPSIKDPEWQYPSAIHSAGPYGLGVYRNLRVCPREWPGGAAQVATDHNTRNGKTSIRNKNLKSSPPRTPKRTLSMVTQILLEYDTFELKDRTRIRIPPINVITWLEYHRMIGFEHFYVYDNDPTRHGPLELLLQPYVDERRVTYIWYPMQDCFRKSHDELDGSRITISQAMSSMMSLRRYEHETEFMGHFDVDEYIQLPNHVHDVKDLVKQLPEEKSSLLLSQQWYHECEQFRSDQTSLQRAANLFPLDKKMCVSLDSTPGKSIMRTKDILGFFVHVPWVKTDHTLFDWDKDQQSVDGLSIAHARGRRARDGIPIQVLGETQYLVSRTHWRVTLQKRVDRRMEGFLGVSNAIANGNI